MYNCTKCGGPMDEAMLFCPECGTKREEPDAWQAAGQPAAGVPAYGQPPAVPPPYGQPPYPQAPAATKSNKTVIIVACVIAGLLILGGIMLFAVRDSIFGAGSTVNPNWRGAELHGNWYRGSGDTIYYLWNTEEIRFIVTGDGVGRVHDDTGEWGDWYIGIDGVLWIEGEEYMDVYGIVALTYRVDGGSVTFTDIDGDARTYSRSRW